MAIKRDPADKAFSEAYRMSQNNTCEHCGKAEGKMELAHIYSRRFRSVRWDTLNALCLCFTCHHAFTGNPLDFHAWLLEYLGQGYMDILNEKRHQINKTTLTYRQGVAKHYKAEIKAMQAGPHDLVSYQ